MASQPELYGRIQSEADALFDGGDPGGEDFTPSAIDVTHRFLMECLRMYPVVPMSIRNVMNSCVVEDYVLPVGSRIYLAQTASHYMNDVFPDPFSFDIDRYLAPRNEHRSPGYAPFGLGTHTCLGSRWMEMQLAINVLMLAHYFTIEVSPANYKLRFSPIPSMKPSKKLKFLIAEQRRELPRLTRHRIAPHAASRTVGKAHKRRPRQLSTLRTPPNGIGTGNAESAIGARVAGL